MGVRQPTEPIAANQKAAGSSPAERTTKSSILQVLYPRLKHRTSDGYHLFTTYGFRSSALEGTDQSEYRLREVERLTHLWQEQTVGKARQAIRYRDHRQPRRYKPGYAAPSVHLISI
jgi:hypothetical protein